MAYQVIGITWDEKSPNLKARLLSDLLKIASEIPDAAVEFLPPKSSGTLDTWYLPMAQYAGIPVVQGKEPAVWRVYIVKEEPLLPDYASDIVRKKLTPPAPRPIGLIPNKDFYPTLERQSDLREVPVGQSLTLNKIPPQRNRNEPYSTPQNFFLSPFITFAAVAVGVLLVLGDPSVPLIGI